MMAYPWLSRLLGLGAVAWVPLLIVGGPVSGEDKAVPVATGAVGELLPIPDEYRKAHVVVYFRLDRAEGERVAGAKAVVVTVYKDAKVERRAGGKRAAITAADIKPGQRIELYGLEEGVRLGDTMRIAPRSVVVEDKGK